jgi:hypothetical protein
MNQKEDRQVAANYNDGGNKVQAEIDRRVKQLMTANRQLGYNDAFNLVMRANPQLASDRWDAVQVQICQKVKELMAANSQLTYSAALSGVLAQDSNLAREYRDARSGLSTATSRPVDDQLGVEIQNLVQEKVAASEGKGYGTALSEVMRERPDLARRYKETMR